MPELPEVETIRRQLLPTLIDRTIVAAELRLPKLMTKWGGLGPEAFAGHRIEGIGRRAKILRFRLSDGLTLLVHLKLSGQLVHRAASGETLAAGGHPMPAFDAPLPHKSTHLILGLDDRSRLFFTDVRQFGRVALMPDEAAEGFLAAMKHGPEPLGGELDLATFRARLARRPKPPIKTLLLDQGFVVGLGNIYANEALGEAGIAPARSAGTLDDAEVERLDQAARATLTEWTERLRRECGDGFPERVTAFREGMAVHGRFGQPCPACGSAVQRIRYADNETNYCARCQTGGRLLADRALSRLLRVDWPRSIDELER